MTDHTLNLIQQQLTGSLDATGQAELDAWLAESAANRQQHARLQQAWEASGTVYPEARVDVAAARNRF